jgi:hypothetical protein
MHIKALPKIKIVCFNQQRFIFCFVLQKLRFMFLNI